MANSKTVQMVSHEHPTQTAVDEPTYKLLLEQASELDLVIDLHAVGTVQQDDDLARPSGTECGARGLIEEGSSERGHDQSECKSAQREKEPVLDTTSTLFLVRDLLEEHQGGKMDDVPSLSAGQVDDDWNDDPCDAQQEERNEERETHRALLARSRERRYWKSASSSGCEVSSSR